VALKRVLSWVLGPSHLAAADRSFVSFCSAGDGGPDARPAAAEAGWPPRVAHQPPHVVAHPHTGASPHMPEGKPWLPSSVSLATQLSTFTRVAAERLCLCAAGAVPDVLAVPHPIRAAAVLLGVCAAVTGLHCTWLPVVRRCHDTASAEGHSTPHWCVSPDHALSSPAKPVIPAAIACAGTCCSKGM
jgi:hypothetical protein